MKIVVVGQTPPPFGGQSVMIEALLSADVSPIELYHVRMAFSQNTAELGRFQPRKLMELCRVLFLIIRARLCFGGDVLYFPPAGPGLIPVLRDTVLLLCVRRMFKKTVFHFHAGGVMAYIDDLNPILKSLARAAYAHPTLSIRTAAGAPPDGILCGSERDVVVPNGAEDLAAYGYTRTTTRERPKILFVGVLCEEKGVLVLMDAAVRLAARGYNFELVFVGAFESHCFERRARMFLSDHCLTDQVTFAGVLSGATKARAFAEADVFCFPSYFSCETFGLVLVEAMSMQLPIVATSWRGIPEVVEHGVEGFLVPVRDPEATADRLEQLLADPELRYRMGAAGRERFERSYTRELFVQRMRAALQLLSFTSGC